MRTTAIFNLKGGVGKTVTTCNLAAELAARDKRVVVIDADPQCNATDFLTGYSGLDFPWTLTDLLNGQQLATELAAAGPLPAEPIAGIRLVPADEALALVDLAAIQQRRVAVSAIRDMCDALAEEDSADYVLIDCPPSFSAATVAALAAADDVIIPLKIDAFSVKGVGVIMRQIVEMLSVNPELSVAGVLLTMVDLRTRVSREGRKLLEDSAVPMYKSCIRYSTELINDTFFGFPARKANPNGRAAQDYGAFCEEYLGGDLNGK